MTIRKRYWAWVNRRQTVLTERGALAVGRFVLYISLYGRRLPIRFVPREEEAPAFFRQFVIPWAFGTGGVFSHQGPYYSPGAPRVIVAPNIEVLRHRDIIAVEIIAPDDAYRERLDRVLKGLVEETRAQMEADQVAQQIGQFTRIVQATVEAHKALERGGQDPKGSG